MVTLGGLLAHADPSLEFANYIRLYALGSDAYRLIPEINSLSRSEAVTFNGATGVLSIDAFGHINRQTRWATFSRGKIKPLPDLVENIVQ